MYNQNLNRKKILITAGWPREDIDGVRHYANHSRSQAQGFAVAEMLAQRNADVTVVTNVGPLIDPKGCGVITHLSNGAEIVSAHDIMTAARESIEQNSFDAALCLASASSIRPIQKSEHKLKVKKLTGDLVKMECLGNISIEALAKSWSVPTLGYTNQQHRFSINEIPLWLHALSPDIWDEEKAACPPTPLFLDDASVNSTFQSLAHKKILMTSGPTVEQLTQTGDVITNFSSGKQGGELALAFARLGAEVTYVTGPCVSVMPHSDRIKVIEVNSACDMLTACLENLPSDVFVAVAAVADFGCKTPQQTTVLENQQASIELYQNPDILANIGYHQSQRPTLVVGFAAETDAENLFDYAEKKLIRKGADLICANLVQSASAQNGNQNQIAFVSFDNKPVFEKTMSKKDTANRIATEISLRLACAERNELQKLQKIDKLHL